MTKISEIKKCLNSFYEQAKSKKEELTEEELRRIFTDTGILKILGYEKTGKDIRYEKATKKGRRTDLQCIDRYGSVIFVVEFKKPADKTPLKDYFDDLWDKYVKPLKARYGVLTNGLKIIIYERIGMNPNLILDTTLSDLALENCESICYWLQKPIHDMTKLEIAISYFQRFSKPNERMPLATDLSRGIFFDDFALKEDSSFSNLIRGTIELFDYQYGKLKEDGKPFFVTSAYDFWLRSYAKKIDKIPDTWKKLLNEFDLSTSSTDLNKFMFCLETAYSLFTRLVLAKACEDYEFPHINFHEFMGKIKGFRGEISLVSWGILLTEWIENMRNSLVESVFEEDIFYWWTDKFDEMRSWETWKIFSPNLVDVELDNFSKYLANILFTLYKYDLSEIAGDPLGDLYQKYFDKETRKSLGEFYTPKEVVNYILDAVEYKGRFIPNKRLLDPACGSGTFLVDALKRYLKTVKPFAEENGWSETIKRLCNEFHIVGFDIHPFATIMSQIHFMLVLIPYYKKAIEEDSRFVLRRIPVFRTDSLIDETKGGKTDIISFTEGIKNIQLKIPLPIKKGIGDKEFVEIDVVMPHSKEVWDKTDLVDIPEYFCALQAIFDTVKYLARNEKYEVDKELLERNLKIYPLEDKNWKNLVNFFAPYANQILSKIKDLKYQFGDGRLVKSIEDVMLAGLLKNYVKYDYVVGNPPYVNVLKIPEEMRKYYLENYSTATGRIDLYIVFLERGIGWLKKKSKLGFINPTKFMVYTYGKLLRDMILQKCCIAEMVDVAHCESVFEQDVETGIFILRKDSEENISNNVINITFIKKDDKQVLLNLAGKDKSIPVEREDYSIYQTNQIAFHHTPNKIFTTQLSKPNYEIMKRMEKRSVTLGEICDIEQCVRIGSKTKREKLIISSISKLIELPKNTKKLCKRILDSEELTKFGINWSGRYLIYKKKELYNPKSEEIFETEKLMFRNTSKRLIVSYDKGFIENRKKAFFYALNTIYTILLKKEGKKEIKDRKEFLKFLVGILNSNPIEFYYRTMYWALHIKGGSMKYREVLANVPIYIPKTKKEKKIADQIISNVEQILSQVKIGQKMEKFPASYLDEYKGMEKEEFKYTFKANHKSLEPIITESVDGGYGIEIGKKEDTKAVETKAKANYLLMALEERKVRKGEKIKILVPKDEKIVKEILEKYEKDKKQLDALPISRLEDKINELVYELYGLNENDKKVIEEFLERF